MKKKTPKLPKPKFMWSLGTNGKITVFTMRCPNCDKLNTAYLEDMRPCGKKKL